MFKDYNQFRNSFYSGIRIYELGRAPSAAPEAKKSKKEELMKEVGIDKATEKELNKWGISIVEMHGKLFMDLSKVYVATLNEKGNVVSGKLGRVSLSGKVLTNQNLISPGKTPFLSLQSKKGGVETRYYFAKTRMEEYPTDDVKSGLKDKIDPIKEQEALLTNYAELTGLTEPAIKKMMDYGIEFKEEKDSVIIDVSHLKVATLWNGKLQTGGIKAPILLKNLPKNAVTSLTQYKEKEIIKGKEVNSQFGESLSLYINGDLFIFTKEGENFEKRTPVQVSRITSVLKKSDGPEKNGVELNEKDLTEAEVAKELRLREKLRKEGKNRERLLAKGKFNVLKKDLDYRLIDQGETVMKALLEGSDPYEAGDWKRLNKKFYEAFKGLKDGILEVSEVMAQRLLVHFQKEVFDQLRLTGDPSAKADGKIGPYSLYAFAMYFKMKRPTKKPALSGNPRLAKLIQEDKKAAYDQFVTRFDMQGFTDFSSFEKRYEKIVTEKDYFDPEKATFDEWMNDSPVL